MLTLEQALQAVADRSFYEPCIVVPVIRTDNSDVLGYLVEDDGNVISTDEVEWSYAGGISRGSENECTRLMDAYESFTDHQHIAWHMDGALEQLQDGNPVWFAYAVVRDSAVEWDDDAQVYRDSDGIEVDDVAGWCLMAHWEER